MRWLTATPIEAFRAGSSGDVDRSQPGEPGSPIEQALDELPAPGLAFDGGDDGRRDADGSHGSGAGDPDRGGVEDEGRIPRPWRVDRI
jgi:hypothetical protein